MLVERDGRAVAVLAGRSGMAIGKPVIRGNFLKPTGNHWDALVAALVPEHLPAAQPPVAPRPPRQSSRPLRPTRPHPQRAPASNR